MGPSFVPSPLIDKSNLCHDSKETARDKYLSNSIHFHHISNEIKSCLFIFSLLLVWLQHSLHISIKTFKLSQFEQNSFVIKPVFFKF